MLRHLLTLFLAGFLLAACSTPRLPPPPTGDPDVALLAREEAETLIRAIDYPGATEMLALAYRQTPDDLPLVLRYGELLEATGQPDRAAAVYRTALQGGGSAASEEVRELRYRLALASLYHLDDAQAARQQLEQLNRASHQALDLQACLLLFDGRADAAISQLRLALELARETRHKAEPAYHLALALEKQGRRSEAIESLYTAINDSEHLGLTRDIETLWKQLKPAN